MNQVFDISQAKAKVERKKGIRDNLLNQFNVLQKTIEDTNKDLAFWEEAHRIIKDVAKETQSELEIHINEIVTEGLASVFDNPYKFKLEFVLRRDKTEADEFWEDAEGNRYLPNGGGVRDISALAFRTAILQLPTNPGAPILLLDEPAKHVRGIELLKRVDNLLLEISKKLNIQIIIMSYTDAITNTAQRYFKVTKEDKVSKVMLERTQL